MEKTITMMKQNEPYHNSEYWEDRIANETWKTYNDIEERNIDLLQMYEKASQNIKNELLTLAEKAEREGELGRSDQYRYKKLLGQQGEIFKECERLGEQIEKHTTNQMIAGGKETYKNVMEALGETQFHMPNKKVMEQMLRSPWHGSFFSERLWKNMGKLEKNLNGVISMGISTGKTITEMAVQLSNIMQSSFNDAHRLVRTETINYLNRSELMAYKKAGLSEVQWWAAEDERTCDVCGTNHGKKYPIDKAPILPCHPGCRCTWLPVVDSDKVMEKGYNNYSDVNECKDFVEMSSYLNDKYKIKVDDSIKSLDFAKCRDTVNGIESLFSDFPELKDNIKEIATHNEGVMCCDGAGIYFNPFYFKNDYDLSSKCKELSNSGWWVKNASISSVGAHETGHAVERLLIDLNTSYDYEFQRTLAWNDGTEAKLIVRQAVKNIKQTAYGKGKKKVDLIKSISGYANKSEQEVLAESFADVYANGNYANPLSIEIKRIVLETYKKYKGD